MTALRWPARLTTVHLFMLLPWIGIVVAARQPIRDNSFLWHIRAGELQQQSGAVLTEDPFSYTFAGESWRTQSWLADLLYAWLHDFDGLAFVPWFIAVVALGTAVLMGVAAFRASGSLASTALVLTLVAWVGVAFLSPRPVLLSYLLLAALVVMLERKDVAWALPLLFWLWATVHGSFVLGIGLLVLHRLSKQRRFALDTAVAVVAASLTAHGLGVWQTLARFIENRPALDLISEWAPPRLTSPDMAPYAVIIALVIWGAASGAISRRDLIVVVPFLLFGLSAARSLFPAVIVLAPYAARAVGSGLDARVGGRSSVHWAFNAAVAVAILALPFLVTPTWEGLSDERFPIEAAEALDTSPVFHDDVVGGYLIYAHPDVPVFVDDRAELFGEDHFRDLITARNGRPGWTDVFAEHGIAQALISSGDGLAEVLSLSGWNTVAGDDDFVLLRAP